MNADDITNSRMLEKYIRAERHTKVLSVFTV